MPTKRIPIAEAKRIAKAHKQSIVCLVTWERETGVQHVVTYGETKQECQWAADLGNQIKEKVLKWPKDQCDAQPARAKAPVKRQDLTAPQTKKNRETVKKLEKLAGREGETLHNVGESQAERGS